MLSVITDQERDYINRQIEAVKSGDQDALGNLYRVAGGRMLSVAMGLVRDKERAEDVLHDSFIRVVRFADGFKSGTNGYAWLCTIVRNTALNKIRSENLRRAENIDSFFNLSDDGISAEQADRVMTVEAAMKKLEPKERTVIWLKYYNDMTVRTIASELNLPKSTVQSIITVAEKKLKKYLE